MSRLLPLLFALVFAVPIAAATVLHPHFPKKVEMTLGFSPDAPKLSVSHLTVTFDEKGFGEMPAGGAWHLANAHLDTGVDLEIGGKKVAKGVYRLLARKKEDGDWELVLDPKEGRFSVKISERAIALDTDFMEEQPLQKHLRIDLQPSGDQEETDLFLEVHFHTYVALARIEAP